ncbi:cupin domain-containing protein [Paenibacillus sp. RC67]|uniref:cupin domain-containing protein n=1 Tax=Paenibacillus sp. RC67 TaxID=3039392 RepID=UPI0024AE388B|nr:cupin domain-containing protein [Paenibacillus sp. RC67]
MNPISDEEAALFGIATKYDLMDNGERRFRLNCSLDGSSYCRTVASDQGAWQNSHYHKSVSELYVVQSGWIVYASKKESEMKLGILRQGDNITFQPGVHHNIYLSSDSVIHTIKYGDYLENDWFSSPELDKLTKHLEPKTLFSLSD